jgi:ELWxxDGT repeat protein
MSGRHTRSPHCESLEPRRLLAGVELVKDIVPGPDPSLALAFERHHTVIAREKFFFVAADETHGRQVWVSDGTAPGTYPLVVPDAAADADPDDLTAGDGVVYFTAQNATGRQVYQTNGKTVDKLSIFQNNEQAHALTFVNGNCLFFTNGTTEAAHGLWRATLQGARLIKAGSRGDPVAVVNNKLIYGQTVSGASEPLGTYATDGFTVTSISSSIADDTRGGTGAIVLKNAALYGASDGNGIELWKSDGTINGTQRLADLSPGALGSDPRNMVRIGDFVYLGPTEPPSQKSPVWPAPIPRQDSCTRWRISTARSSSRTARATAICTSW